MESKLDEWDQQALAAYIADYINEELTREGVGHNIDSYMVRDAIDAFIGGADESDAPNNPRILGQIFGG
jgi:hypothetical protein